MVDTYTSPTDAFKKDTTMPSNRGANPRLLTATSVIGDRVRNDRGETLGKIDNIMLDLETGRVHYCVISSGGFLGIGDKLFAIPMTAMRVDGVNREFVLNIDKEMLEKAPGFDKNSWPDFTNRQYEEQIYNYYGASPYWEEPVRH